MYRKVFITFTLIFLDILLTINQVQGVFPGVEAKIDFQGVLQGAGKKLQKSMSFPGKPRVKPGNPYSFC